MGLLLNRTNTNILHPINKNVDGLIAASNGLMCLKQMIFGAFMSPATIVQGLATVAAAMVSSIINAVTEVVNERVNQIIRSALSPFRKLEEIITDLTTILIETQLLLDKATNMNNYFQNRQDCSGMAANLLSCLAQSAIDKVTNKVAMEVDKHVGKIADNVSKEAFKTNGIIDNFVDRNTKFLEKANLQNKLLI
jgi:hypothetical protein